MVSELKYTFPNTFRTARARVSRNLKPEEVGELLVKSKEMSIRTQRVGGYYLGFTSSYAVEELPVGNIAGTESRTHDLLACGVVPAYLTSNNVILPYWFGLELPFMAGVGRPT